jgi:tRNA(His) 5'-end guanylyltransferase
MDNLGDRMKAYEQMEAGRRFLPLLPVCARLDGKSFHRLSKDLQRVNWNNYPTFFKRDTFVQKQTVTRQFTAEEMDTLPAQHDARKYPELTVERTAIRCLDMPPFAKVMNRVDVIFADAQPKVKQE